MNLHRMCYHAFFEKYSNAAQILDFTPFDFSSLFFPANKISFWLLKWIKEVG